MHHNACPFVSKGLWAVVVSCTAQPPQVVFCDIHGFRDTPLRTAVVSFCVLVNA